jgi:hypothetical protein
MDKEEKKRLAEVLMGSAELFGRELSQIALVLYIRALEDLPIDDCVKALGELCRTGKYFPRPGEVREMIMGPELTYEEEAEIEAAKVFTEMQHYSPMNDVVFDNPTTMAVIQQGMGGWLTLTGGLTKERPFLRKQFKDLYTAYRKADIKSYGKLLGEGGYQTENNLKLVGDRAKALEVMRYRKPEELEAPKGKTLQDVLELARTIGSHS